MIKHYFYYFSLAVMAMCAVDLVFDSAFRFVLYSALGWAIPPYGEKYDAVTWKMHVSETDWLNNRIVVTK